MATARAAASQARRIAKYAANPANAEKIQARRLCNLAIRTGKLVRGPCEKCASEKTEAHHEDYSKPLAVNWLCRKCHNLLHQNSHCKRGHALVGDNIQYSPEGGRRCLECIRANARHRYHASKEISA